MRWRTLGLRKSRCIGENPVFPQVIYQKKDWIFVTCLEQMLHNAGHWAVTLNISKKNSLIIKMAEFLIKDLFCIFSSNFVEICHPLISIGLCHLCTCIVLITLIALLFLSNSIRHEPTSSVYLISCINRDFWRIAAVDATRWRKIATTRKKYWSRKFCAAEMLK